MAWAASDAGVALGLLKAAAEGAAANVRINLGQLKDKKFSSRRQKRVQKVSADSEALFRKIIRIVKRKLS